MPTTFDGVTEAARDVDRFSSSEIGVVPIPFSYDSEGKRFRSIITSGATDQKPERRIMLPFFAPKAVERYRESTRDLCRQMIRGFIEDGKVDAGGDYARKVPPRVIAKILGIDGSMSDEFTFWVQNVLELGLQDPPLREKYRQIIEDFFVEIGRASCRERV